VPVVFKMSQGAEADVTTGVFVTAQKWGHDKAQKGFMVGLTPISYKFKSEIKRKFGGGEDDAVRFSRERTETPEFKDWFKD
ncbi:hypothetical protein, partial [Salmonella enterica]|uniref:hypothetical protein n=1 Tax=Salmonella enterica TaxID=28901 RepID=UPI00163F8CCE